MFYTLQPIVYITGTRAPSRTLPPFLVSPDRQLMVRWDKHPVPTAQLALTARIQRLLSNQIYSSRTQSITYLTEFDVTSTGLRRSPAHKDSTAETTQWPVPSVRLDTHVTTQRLSLSPVSPAHTPPLAPRSVLSAQLATPARPSLLVMTCMPAL